MADERADYRAYLLRLWRTGGAEPAWRASLESASTGERRGFGSLETLLAFLRAEFAGEWEEAGPPRPDERGAGERDAVPTARGRRR